MAWNGSRSDGTLNAQADGGHNPWLAQGMASAAIMSAVNVIISRLCTTWVNYRDFSAGAPGLDAELQEVAQVLGNMKEILSDDRFRSAMSDDEIKQVANLLTALEQKSTKVQSSLAPFLPPLVPPAGYRPTSNITDSVTDPSLHLAPVRATIGRISSAFTSCPNDVAKSIRYFKTDSESVREEIAQLLVRYRCQLNEDFVQKSLSKTRYRSTNEITLLIERPGNFSETELKEFNLVNKYASLEPSPELDRSYEGHEPPLRWYSYTTVNGMRGAVLVETKWGPYHNSTDRDRRAREDDYENLRAVYGLVRQFRAANNDHNDKYGVLSCLGFYYHQEHRTDNSILLVWEPPSPISGFHNIPNMVTLRELLEGHVPIAADLKALGKRLVRAVYELLQARWYHRTICANNVVFFDNHWEKAYLVGFRTARFTDGHSDPSSRPRMYFKDVY